MIFHKLLCIASNHRPHWRQQHSLTYWVLLSRFHKFFSVLIQILFKFYTNQEPRILFYSFMFYCFRMQEHAQCKHACLRCLFMRLCTVSTKLHLGSKVLWGYVSPQIIVAPTSVLSAAQVQTHETTTDKSWLHTWFFLSFVTCKSSVMSFLSWNCSSPAVETWIMQPIPWKGRPAIGAMKVEIT